MRTQQEIVDRINERAPRDPFAFETPQLLSFLDFEHAKPFLKEGVTPEQWEQADQHDVKKIMLDYLTFAWEKCNNGRGISANRSISHYEAWLWIEGSPEALELASGLWDDYCDYGRPQLEAIGKFLGVPSGYEQMTESQKKAYAIERFAIGDVVVQEVKNDGYL